MVLVSGSTATVRRLADAGCPGLGHLLTPKNRNTASVFGTGLPWAADNGCFGGLDASGFRKMLAKVKGRAGCLFVVCPDVVASAAETLRLWREWRAEVADAGHPVAFVGQDGCERLPIPWGEIGAWFVGGSTEWKLSEASRRLCAEAKARGLWAHMGRVNSLRRMRAASLFGCDSVDGSSMSMFGDAYVRRFALWAARTGSQPHLFGPRAPTGSSP